MANKERPYKRAIATAAIVILLSVGDLFIWRDVIARPYLSAPHDYFLDVGEGDAEIVVFPGNVKVMVDAGQTDSVVGELGKVLPRADDYIDVAIISEPQADHINGYMSLLDHYRVGVFVYNGRDDISPNSTWASLKEKIQEKGIPLVTLARGDSIHYDMNQIEILSPNPTFDQSADLDDTGLVVLVKTPGLRTLFTADIGANVEDWLLDQGADLRAEVLKVGRHGSKYASSDAFLRAVDPDVAVIEVAPKSAYGDPASSTLARFASSTNASLLRTDQDGTVEIYPRNGKLEIVEKR